jgi:hypothetical protein
MNDVCKICDGKKFTWGKNVFPNGRVKVPCECTKTQKNEPLNEEQVKNWRNVMGGILGPYASLMPIEKIEAIRDCLQKETEKLK